MPQLRVLFNLAVSIVAGAGVCGEEECMKSGAADDAGLLGVRYLFPKYLHSSSNAGSFRGAFVMISEGSRICLSVFDMPTEELLGRFRFRFTIGVMNDCVGSEL